MTPSPLRKTKIITIDEEVHAMGDDMDAAQAGEIRAARQVRQSANPTGDREPGPSLPPLRIPTLLMDLYELTMAQSYFNHGMFAPATFSLFTRRLPNDWGYFLAAGLDDVLSYLEEFRFGEDEIRFLETTGLFTPAFLDYLGNLRFTGSVRALPEGTVFLPHEPVLEVMAPIIQAQLIETAIVNQVHLQTIIATKASRCVLAAQGRQLVEFGLRRTHGSDAGLKVAKSTYLAGFDSTSNVLAGQVYGIPIAGTMAHSYIQAFPNEIDAFRAFAETYPDNCVLLVDTYDTLEGTRRAAIVGRELAARGHRLRGVRLDSGDLFELSPLVRAILDDAGLPDVTIFASGGVDEHFIAEAVQRSAPIDGFGVGTKLGVSADAPYLDMAFKMVAYEGRPVLKLSAGKATWPGPKQVWRLHTNGAFEDQLTRLEEAGPVGAEPLLEVVMKDGKRVSPRTLADAREHTRQQLTRLPVECRRLESPCQPQVRFSEALVQLRDEVAVRAAGSSDASA